MTTYQLVPYLLTVHVKGKPDETRPLDDLFGGKELLEEELGKLLVVHHGDIYEQGGSAKRPLRLRVEHVGVGTRQLSFTISPARSGIESTIMTPTGKETPRNFDDMELVPLRHQVSYAAGSHRAILFAERVGGDGAITALAGLLKDTWRANQPDTVLEINAAMSDEAWQASLAQRPVKGWRFTKPATQNGNLLIGGQFVEYTLDVKPAKRGARWKLDHYIKQAQKDGAPSLTNLILQEVTPILAPGATPEKAAQALYDEGWRAAVQLQLEGNVSRTVIVEQSLAISMSFPIIDGEEEPGQRPTDPEVESAVQRIVGDGILSQWGLGKHHSASCAWVAATSTEKGKWRAEWHVVNQPGPSGP